MSNPGLNEDALQGATRERIMSGLFAHMVIQNTNMALMFLGEMPHPESGERLHDFESAKLFIDQLEMLECKTKGNLTHEEEKLLQQSLTHLRLTFVQAIEHPPKAEPSKQADTPAPAPSPAPEQAATSETGESESRKRFSKKF